MFVALTFAIAAIGQVADPKGVDLEPRYAAFWLTDVKGRDDYPKLLIARRPLPEIVKQAYLFERADVPLFERWGLVITTYKKGEIHNTDLRPIKPLTRLHLLNEKEHTVEANGVRCRYEECPLADAIRLLKEDQGDAKIARINPPLAGMEETARALRLLLEAQVKERELKE